MQAGLGHSQIAYGVNSHNFGSRSSSMAIRLVGRLNDQVLFSLL